MIIRNDAAQRRAGVAFVELIEKIGDEPVGPGSGGGQRFDEFTEKAAATSVPSGMQVIATRIARNRIESPRHYPDNDIVRVTSVATIVGEQPAFGLVSSEWPGPTLGVPKSRVRASTNELSNTILNCEFADDGVVSLEGAHRISTLIRFDDREDRGDLYTPSIGSEVAVAQFLKRRVVHRGPVVGEVVLRWKRGSAAEQRSTGRGDVEVSVRMVAGSPALELAVSGTNSTRNHRLRIGIATGVTGGTVVADAAFGPIERLPVEVTTDEARMEHAPRTAPLHRYVSLFTPKIGATVFSDGLAEYEADADGVVWITLVRSVGDLSRNDLPERAGHAGWPVDTPDAQCIGLFEARLAVFLHGGRTPATLDDIEREAEVFLAPLSGFTVRSASAMPEAFAGPELTGMISCFRRSKKAKITSGWCFDV